MWRPKSSGFLPLLEATLRSPKSKIQKVEKDNEIVLAKAKQNLEVGRVSVLESGISKDISRVNKTHCERAEYFQGEHCQ